MPLTTLIARQSGVISREQAVAAGLHPHEIDRRLRLRRWRPVHPGVYLTGHRRPDDETRVRAALLWGGRGAVLAGQAAAWWHGMAAPPAEIALVVPAPVRPCRGVRARAGRLAAQDVQEHRGVLVTRPALSVLLAASEIEAATLDRLLWAEVTLPAVHAAYRRNRHVPGVAPAGRAVREAVRRLAGATEEALVRLLCAAGTRGWRRGLQVAGRRAAVVFPLARVVVEPAGRVGPDEPGGSWPGWTVLEVSRQDVTERPERLLAEIAAAVARARAAGEPSRRPLTCTWRHRIA